MSSADVESKKCLHVIAKRELVPRIFYITPQHFSVENLRFLTAESDKNSAVFLQNRRVHFFQGIKLVQSVVVQADDFLIVVFFKREFRKYIA